MEEKQIAKQEAIKLLEKELIKLNDVLDLQEDEDPSNLIEDDIRWKKWNIQVSLDSLNGRYQYDSEDEEERLSNIAYP